MISKSKVKIIKDPLYGYINLPYEILHVVDTPVFQRLRDIVQTSYTSLYPSAVPSRFTHSLGVYHLGTLASGYLRSDSLLNRFNFDVQEYFSVFEYACLLHDVGHAPFSHTGEFLFLKDGERTSLHQRLIKLTKDEILESEISNNGYKAAPHELTSAVIGIESFGEKFKEKKSFFARCITGYKYTIDLDEEKKFQNCLIELLNSKIIDVDKLDYLLRDTYFAGMEAIQIDYQRLLSNLCFVCTQTNSSSERESIEIGFNKNAISVLENVIYAHDLERKWIQNHPAVIYESYLLEVLLEHILRDKIQKDNIDFSLLSEKGCVIPNNEKIRLLSDSTITHYIKTLDNDAFAEEYLNRQIRKKPLWKSESEFNAIFFNKEHEVKIITEELENLEKYINTSGGPFVINMDNIKKCNKEIEELKEKKSGDEKNKSLLAAREKNKELMEILLESVDDKKNNETQIVIKFTKQFISGFSKKEFSTLKIKFPSLEDSCNFGDITSLLKSSNSEEKNLFYIYVPSWRNKSSIKNIYEKLLNFAHTVSLEKDRSKFSN